MEEVKLVLESIGLETHPRNHHQNELLPYASQEFLDQVLVHDSMRQ